MEAKCDDDGNLANNDDSDTVMTAGIMVVKMLLLLLTKVIDTSSLSLPLTGVDYSVVHRFPGPDLCIFPCLPGRERQQLRLQHLCRLPLVGDSEYYMIHTGFLRMGSSLSNLLSRQSLYAKG